jgi:ATP-dependent exoDNAse (exonuclease V) alpha subunit
MGEKSLAHIQIPLRLAWAVTVHKSQGLTLPKIKLGLGKKEFAAGLTFVGLSRVKALSDIMIVGQLDYSRVKNLSGKNLQHQLDDFSRRYS